jgi:hypothetical protein
MFVVVAVIVIVAATTIIIIIIVITIIVVSVIIVIITNNFLNTDFVYNKVVQYNLGFLHYCHVCNTKKYFIILVQVLVMPAYQISHFPAPVIY